ncbi:MAG: SufD family Fe-S cluster assembly protein [Rickettsiales bacterium]|jgi:hypothetical protein|nr:SufD family Fe-S cluster assembly protein [Rickettsiales bacterium]
MAYLFDDFKSIRTFPANTRVYRDGVFAPELSSENEGAGLPLHIIHVGKITGRQDWIVDMNRTRGRRAAGSANVFLTARIEVEGAAKINLEINANIAGAAFDGAVFVKNAGDLTLNVIGNNNKGGTKIACRAKLFAMAGSSGDLSGVANIPAGVPDAGTSVEFSALCRGHVKLLKMSPAQRISSVPAAAGHGASIYRPAPAQIHYLETAGLPEDEAAALLNRVFLEEEV